MQDQHKTREMQDAEGAQELLRDLLDAIDQSGSPGLRRHFVQGHADGTMSIPGNWALWTIESLCRLSVDEIVKAGDSSVYFIEMFATDLIQRLTNTSSTRKTATVTPKSSKAPIGGRPRPFDRRTTLANRYGQLRRKHQDGLPFSISQATLLRAGFDHPESPVADLSIEAFLKLDQKTQTSLFRKENLSLFEECVDVVERFLACRIIADEAESKHKCTGMRSLSAVQIVSPSPLRQPVEIKDTRVKEPQPNSQLHDQRPSKEIELDRRFKHLRDRLNDGEMDTIRTLTMRQVRGPMDVYLPALVLDQTVEEFLLQPFGSLLVNSAVAPWRLERLLESIENIVTGQDHEPVAPVRFRNLAKAIRDPEYAELATVHLSSLLRPDDKYVPQLLTSKTIAEIFNLSFEELEAIRGIGKTKIDNLLDVLQRELTSWSARSVIPLGAITKGELPERQQVLPWEIALKRIEQNKMGYEMLGHLAPKLRSLPHRFWRRRFCDYFGLTPTEIEQLDGHGDVALQSLFLVFEAVGQSLPHEPMNEQLAILLQPFHVHLSESILLDLLAADSEELTINDIGALAQPLLEQIEIDLDLQCSEIVSRFCGLTKSSATINPTSLADIAEAIDLSKERVRQVMVRVEELMMIRWPSGPQMLECVAIKSACNGRHDIADALYELRARLFGVSDRLPVLHERHHNAAQAGRLTPATSRLRDSVLDTIPSQPRSLTLTEHVREVLKDSPHGLKLKEIAATVLTRGYHTESRKFENVVYQALHREPEFILDKHRKRYFHRDRAPQDQKLFESFEGPKNGQQQTALVNDLLMEFLDSDEFT